MNRRLCLVVCSCLFIFSCKLTDKKQSASADNKLFAKFLDNYYEKQIRLFRSMPPKTEIIVTMTGSRLILLIVIKKNYMPFTQIILTH
jgi:hypothetical protein